MPGTVFDKSYDVAVIGAGHAGVEAGLASARMGLKTLVLCMDLDSVALMACNPSLGGTSKGHLVCEVDALGGEMGLAGDDCFIQMRMLNTGKGPAVQSLRAQIDKRRYHERMKRALENEALLDLMQDECAEILTENGSVRLQVISPEIVRVTVSPDGKFHDRPSLVVLPQQKNADFKLSKEAGKVLLSTSALSVEVSKADGTLQFFKADGTP
ncbi:MAG: FAD-dependent oxidoreductase, partial [Oscillospiraceae bacterium]|nr:FAD-dependent oxidoreductase [Oscillospiraceae bacterium]